MPEALGVLRFAQDRLAGRPAQLIEYRRFRRRAVDPPRPDGVVSAPDGESPVYDGDKATLP
jgi:hypothetical protein